MNGNSEKLKDRFSMEKLRSVRNQLLPHLLVPLLESNNVSNFQDLSVEGWFGVVVVVKRVEDVEFLRNAVAAGMDVDPETVYEEGVGGAMKVTCEMSCGSHSMPWPEFAMLTFDSVNAHLKGSGYKAHLVF